MNVTVKTLAQAAGVSRGTVDRVLHGRGGVRADVEQKVKELARQMGYVPNRAGRALAANKTHYKIGVLLPSVGNIFFDGVIEGIEKARDEFYDMGIDVVMRKVQGFVEDTHLSSIDALIREGCQALCLTTVNTPALRDKINALAAAGIKTVLVNTDVEESRRICYVGSDYYHAGKTCAGMLALIAPKRRLKILIVTGSLNMFGHNLRIRGFEDQLAAQKIDFTEVAVVESNDSDITAQQLTTEYLNKDPEINCVYVTGAGVQGVGAALIAHGREDIIAIAYDDIYSTKELVKAGIVKFVLCQQPQRQGYHAIKRAYQALNGIIGEDTVGDFITDNLIKIGANID